MVIEQTASHSEATEALFAEASPSTGVLLCIPVDENERLVPSNLPQVATQPRRGKLSQPGVQPREFVPVFRGALKGRPNRRPGLGPPLQGLCIIFPVTRGVAPGRDKSPLR